MINGASTDGTGPWLDQQPELCVIHEDQREGAVRAFNRGFHAARGTFVMWLNDDAYPLPGSIDAAVAYIDRPDNADVGMVAFYHTWHSERNVLDSIRRDGRRFCVCHVRGTPYANFGLLRLDLLQRIGYADEGYRFFAFDPDLALTIQHREGLRVLGCRDALIVHDEHHDQRKREDLPTGDRDNARLFAKWNLPPPGTYDDPTPAYQRLIQQRNSSRTRQAEPHPSS